MPGLAGAYDLHAGAAEIDRIMQQMRRVLDVPPFPFTVQCAAADGVGCLTFLRGDQPGRLQPVRDQLRRVWLMLDGEIYNADDLRDHLGPGPPLAKESDAAALCLALYLDEGQSFVRRLNGQFNLVVWHEIERTLLIATDRYGYRPLFVTQGGPRLLFATEMKAIMAVLDGTPPIDDIGVLWLASTGRLFGDRTWIEPIRVVEPGTILEVSDRGVSRRRYFRLGFRAPPKAMGLDEYVEGFAAALAGAAARMMQASERVGITLSGGLDSRSALLALSAHHRLAAACTFGVAGSRDAQYAEQLAACVNVPHVRLPYQPGYLGRVLAPIVWRTEGLVPFAATQYTSLHFHPQMAALMDVIVYGHCGDTLTGAHLRPDLVATRSRRQLIERIFWHHQQCAPAMLQRIFNPSFYRRSMPEVRDAGRATFADIEQDSLADVASVWDLEHQQRRSVFHSPTLDRYRFEVRTPFLDNDLVDYQLQAPLRWRFEQIAYKRMIVSAFPKAAQVPWAYTGRQLHGDLLGDLRDVGNRFIANRARRYWPRLVATEEARSPEFRNLAADLRAAESVARVIREFARSAYFPAEIFDRDGIEEIVSRHWERREDHTHLVVMLATFATAWRMFIAEPPTVMPPDAQPEGSALQ